MWFTDLSKVEVTTAATGVGGGREVSMPGVRVREVFTAWDPPNHFAFTVIEGCRWILRGCAERRAQGAGLTCTGPVNAPLRTRIASWPLASEASTPAPYPSGTSTVRS